MPPTIVTGLRVKGGLGLRSVDSGFKAWSCGLASKFHGFGLGIKVSKVSKQNPA